MGLAAVSYLESDLELLGRLDQELQAAFHHAGGRRARPMPSAAIVKQL